MSSRIVCPKQKKHPSSSIPISRMRDRRFSESWCLPPAMRLVLASQQRQLSSLMTRVCHTMSPIIAFALKRIQKIIDLLFDCISYFNCWMFDSFLVFFEESMLLGRFLLYMVIETTKRYTSVIILSSLDASPVSRDHNSDFFLLFRNRTQRSNFWIVHFWSDSLWCDRGRCRCRPNMSSWRFGPSFVCV